MPGKKSFVVTFLLAFILSAGMLYAQAVNANPVAMTLLETPNGFSLGVVQTNGGGACVPDYKATVALQVYDYWTWRTVWVQQVDMGDLQSSALSPVVGAKKAGSEFSLGANKVPGLYRAVLWGFSTSGGGVNNCHSGWWYHYETAYAVSGNPLAFPPELRGAGSFITGSSVVNNTLSLSVSGRNDTRVVVYQLQNEGAALTKVFQLTGFPESQKVELDLSEFSSGVDVSVHVQDMMTGASSTLAVVKANPYRRMFSMVEDATN